MIDDPKFWRPFQGDRAEYAGTTECRYIELLQFSAPLGFQRSEGSLNDMSLESWLTKVVRSIENKDILLTTH